MTIVRWRGDAPAVKQVIAVTVGGTPANGQVYTVTWNGSSVAYTAGDGDTNASIAAALQARLAATELAEVRDVI
jgi:phage tail sheath gpL-like